MKLRLTSLEIEPLLTALDFGLKFTSLVTTMYDDGWTLVTTFKEYGHLFFFWTKESENESGENSSVL